MPSERLSEKRPLNNLGTIAKRTNKSCEKVQEVITALKIKPWFLYGDARIYAESDVQRINDYHAK